MLIIRGKVFGIGDPLLCVPICASDRNELLSMCKKSAKHGADMIEWRADYYEDDMFEDGLMDEIRNKAGNIPILFTYRTIYEGGHIIRKEGGIDSCNGCFSADGGYFDIIKKAADILKPDLIDMEINISSHIVSIKNPDDTLSETIKYIKEYGITVIGSYHNFEETPALNVMEEQFEKMHQQGTDILKIAVMPNSKQDVEDLISFSISSKARYSEPIITISMGEMGTATRIEGYRTGSAVTFTPVERSSAPGQLNIDEVRSLVNSDERRHIYLVGYMGCGKSSVAKRLAMLLGRECVDTDDMIEDIAGMSIPEIFGKYGENYFRELETESLIRLSSQSRCVVACGGGIVLKKDNIAIMKKTGRVILLTAEPEVIYNRVSHSSNRPLLNDNMNVGYIEEMLKKREACYKQSADYIIGTDNVSIYEVTQDIISHISSKNS